MIGTLAKATPLSLMFGLLMSASAAQAEDKLLLVHRSDLLSTPPGETLLGQEIWDMHTTSLSRTSIVRLDETAPAVRHAQGERTLIVLEGKVDFTFADGRRTLGVGDYVAIPAGQTYQMAPAGETKPLLLGFDVPVISMQSSDRGDLTTPDKAAAPVIKTQAAIMASPTNWNDPSDRGWTLVKTAEKRVNLVEMFSELKNHSHPDADHSLILLKGSARVVTPKEERLLKPGDYVSIPQNVPHKYYVEGGQPALFISFDAPAYDSAKTIYFE
ncbi:cupin domain-containing protein [Pseudomonas sp. BN414]|uniref:cupin domain-containing protein n=1 Tax=Pseudomonas sp. BN414 TaxID=2567888 RepID=UPI0024539204|nr:cupin domain-containing protein [Pseudomonas sp. BN414]MDH4567095.1 cupin domain-containing protein [Pseudomonas sp. BN414]